MLGSPTLLHEIFGNDCGFQGYVVSDCGAIDDIFKNHKIVNTAPEAAALSLNEERIWNAARYESALLEAMHKGFLTEEDITTAVKRLFTARFRLGMFDPPEKVPVNRIPIQENDSQEHRQVSSEPPGNPLSS